MLAEINGVFINMDVNALRRIARNDSKMQRIFRAIADFFKELWYSVNGETDKAFALKMQNKFEKLLTEENVEDIRNNIIFKYSVNSSKENNIIKKLNDNIEKIKSIPPVKNLKDDIFKKGDKDLITQVLDYFNSIGNNVYREKFGNVKLNKDGIKSSIGHKIGRVKAITFKAVPSVIKDGVMIEYAENWKNRNYDTYIFAAPVLVNDVEFYMGVVVKKNLKNSEYYLHEVIDQDGNIAIIKKEGTESFKTESIAKKASLGDSTPFINNISQPGTIVNNNSMQNSGKNVDASQSSDKRQFSISNTSNSQTFEETKETSEQEELSSEAETKLTYEDEGAILQYKSSDSYKINYNLYSGEPLTENEKEMIRRTNSALDKMPKYKGTVYTNITFCWQGQEAFDEFVGKHISGREITYNSFTSTSKTKDGYEIEGDLTVHFEIESIVQ